MKRKVLTNISILSLPQSLRYERIYLTHKKDILNDASRYTLHIKRIYLTKRKPIGYII